MLLKVTRDHVFMSNSVSIKKGVRVLKSLDALDNSSLGMFLFPGYEVGRYLGKGASSLVFEVFLEESAYALKVLTKRIDDVERDGEENIELEILTFANQENVEGIIRFESELFTPSLNYKGLLLHPVGSTVTHISGDNFSGVLTLLKGLSWLHSKGYLHRDINPQNIIVTDDGDFRLIDFAFALDLNESNRAFFKGTRPYSSRNALTCDFHDGLPYEITYSISDDLESFLLTLYALSNRSVERIWKLENTQEILDYWNRHIFSRTEQHWNSLFKELPNVYESTWYERIYNKIPRVD
eukprot:TRINITY_DN517_c1_g1_i1.p1 TRINITY_DN517_c1_g1~~TRINITY_DN517_c1_g1_i1.p1  ORF type:complete len:296 (-),score=55.02 TRINITY_DN517_c1_g1_i1:61-948(-)